MQDNPHNISINSNDSTHRSEERIKQLHTQITLTQKDLEGLFTKPGKFSAKVIELNSQAIQNLQSDRPDQALLYLTEAEKILQKAGEKGYEAEKRLIVLTLHNLACAYQRNWELDVCANYLEALIYNLNLILKNTEGSPCNILKQLPSIKQSPAVSPKSLSTKAMQSLLSIQLNQRIGRYYLQFCAVNSQIRNHSGALISARKSIQAMKRTFYELFILMRQHTPSESSRQQFDQKLRLIHQVSRINDSINVSQYEMILETTKYYLKKWQNSEEKEMVMSEISTQIETRFRNFSIGSIAQMNPVQYQELFLASESKKNQLIKTQSIIEKVLVLIIGYFTISTELRLLAQSKHPISQLSEPGLSIHLPNSHEPQTREAQIFHLFSILLASIFIPFEILYMKHILLSYKNHYGVDLFDQKAQTSQNSKVYDEFLFTISQIRRGSMRLGQGDSDIKISQIKLTDEAKKNKLNHKDTFNKFSHIISDLDEKPSNPKSKSKGKRKTKSKSQNKKSTLKTISALSAHSKNKQKIQPTNSKSPQIHTQPSLSKSKHKKSSLKLPLKITSLQHMADQNMRKKQKSKDLGKKKHEYANIKAGDMKKKKIMNGIEQTNAYFLKKGSNVKSQSKSKGKDSKIKREGVKGLVNNPTELYFHKLQKSQKLSKSKSKQKSLKKPPTLQKMPNITSSMHSKKSLYTHYL